MNIKVYVDVTANTGSIKTSCVQESMTTHRCAGSSNTG